MSYVEDNAAARERVLNLVRDLTDEQLARPLNDDWTIGAELAHLAFWDRVHVNRLRYALNAGRSAPVSIPDGLTDIINNASLPAWRAVPGRTAIRLFESASAEVDGYLRTLDPVVAEGVRIAGMPRLIERFRHRNEHAEAIERHR